MEEETVEEEETGEEETRESPPRRSIQSLQQDPVLPLWGQGLAYMSIELTQLKIGNRRKNNRLAWLVGLPPIASHCLKWPEP